MNVHHLRDQIGLVNQEPTLFATSIAGNIAYGCPGVTIEQIEAAARLSNAHDFIASFPDGYNTQVGDKGTQLSGGEYKDTVLDYAILIFGLLRITTLI